MEDSEKIKIAVEEALRNKQLEDLATAMADLKTQMAVGFKGTHDRQDHTNGTVTGHTAEIAAIKAKNRYDKLIWYILTLAIGVITFLITNILGRN